MICKILFKSWRSEIIISTCCIMIQAVIALVNKDVNRLYIASGCQGFCFLISFIMYLSLTSRELTNLINTTGFLNSTAMITVIINDQKKKPKYVVSQTKIHQKFFDVFFHQKKNTKKSFRKQSNYQTLTLNE